MRNQNLREEFTMSFESFQLNLKLTSIGYNKVMALDGKPVSLKFIALGKGNAAGSAGYSVDFRDTKTALLHEVVRKQIDSSQKTSYTDDNGTPLARLDFAAIFNDNSSFDVWEMGFFDDVGDLIYIWSHPTDVFAPKRPNIHLAISVSQHLLFAEEASGVIVQDAGVPFELFLQPLKDDFTVQMQLMMSNYLSAAGASSVAIMQQEQRLASVQSTLAALQQSSAATSQILIGKIADADARNADEIRFAAQKFETEIAGIDETGAATLAATGAAAITAIQQEQRIILIQSNVAALWQKTIENNAAALAKIENAENRIGATALEAIGGISLSIINLKQEQLNANA